MCTNFKRSPIFLVKTPNNSSSTKTYKNIQNTHAIYDKINFGIISQLLYIVNPYQYILSVNSVSFSTES